MRETRESSASHVAATVPMVCDFCGATEQLPADARQRVLALRVLATERRWASDAATGPALAYLKMMETSKTVMMPYAFGLLLAIATVLRAPPSPYTRIPIGVIGGAALATYLVYRVCRARLRSTVGPLIRAFPALAGPGTQQRCRRCGGELPATVVAFVECAYCGAANLLSHAAAVEHADVLRARTADQRLYARETADRVAAEGRWVARLFTAGFFVGAGVGALAALAMS